MRQTSRTQILRWNGCAVPDSSSDELAVEEPLEIRIGGEPITVTMRTPGQDLELVAGLLLSENLLHRNRRPLLRQEHPNVVNVALSSVVTDRLEHLRRIAVVSTSCGLCGKATVESLQQNFAPVHNEVTFSRTLLPALLEALETSQPYFKRTGGVHAAAVFDREGRVVVAREDVGRHNAVDKVVGNAVLRGMLPLSESILLVSGRASFEIVQKALGASIPIIAAVSAPSSLAVELAAASGQTLLGFVRGSRCNVYTHPERVTS